MSHKILIVEDNKTLAKLIATKIESSLDFKVDIAYTMKEAKLFLKMYKYFITLLDINLPDAPNGEIVDYTLAKENHAIILSGIVDKEFREKMLKKNIIDYVNKGGINDINYIISTIDRLQKNKAHTVLVVDDSIVFRKQMQSILSNLFFKVVTVAHGEEALNLLKTDMQVDIVLTDYHMPVMDGLELTYEIRQLYSKNELVILAVSGNQDNEVNALFLKTGANDFITKPFSREEFSCRVNNTMEALENIQKITNNANRDYMTGLYNRRYFFRDILEYDAYAKESSQEYAIGMIDIDDFKKINDTYGHDTGDKVIISLSEILQSATDHKDIVARFGGEEFCVLLKGVNKTLALKVFENIRALVERFAYPLEADGSISFTISIGVALSSEESYEEVINQADMMLYSAKREGKNRVIV